MKLGFFGAAKQVTGSMHLLQTNNKYNLMIDCGMDYEQQRNVLNSDFFDFPFSPTIIDCVVLTHAHIDHCGNLPLLVSRGFRGKILCTEPTAELTRLLLADSLHIMEKEWEKLHGMARVKKGKKKNKSQLPYYYGDIREVFERMITIPYEKPFRINEELEITFTNSGHILGAASVKVEVNEEGNIRKVGYTGDLGNYNSKLVVDAKAFTDEEIIVSESTYGARLHSKEYANDILLKYAEQLDKNEGGKLIIPAFSVGRSHAIAFTYCQLYLEGKLPQGIKVYIDSPLAFTCAELYMEYVENLNQEAKDFYKKHKTLFDIGPISFVQDLTESELVSMTKEKSIIISAAGMVEGGRIQKHIRENISNPKSIILIAGYCATGTLGNKLLQGLSTITMGRKEFPVYASIHKTDAFSAHPDQEGLIRFLKESDNENLKNIFLVHGDESSAIELKKQLSDYIRAEIKVPSKGQLFTF